MQLINDLIQTLSSKDKTLEDALLKTKVLSYKIGDKKLTEWVNLELNGYSDSSSIPDYRKVSSRVVISATDGFTTRWSNYPAPLLHLPDNIRTSLQKRSLGHSIAGLEHLANSTTDTLSTTLPPEFCSFIAMGVNPEITVESGEIQIARSDIIQMISKIKSRLLDFILELNDKIPPNTTELTMKNISEKIDANKIFSHTMFGDNTTIIVGNNNSQNVSINISKFDFEALTKTLKNNNVEDSDIKSLENAIKLDENSPPKNKQEFGSNVKKWMKSMLGKAIDSSWQIELNVASNLITNALVKYYGLG